MLSTGNEEEMSVYSEERGWSQVRVFRQRGLIYLVSEGTKQTWRSSTCRGQSERNQRFERGAAKAQHVWGIALKSFPKGKLLEKVFLDFPPSGSGRHSEQLCKGRGTRTLLTRPAHPSRAGPCPGRGCGPPTPQGNRREAETRPARPSSL